ncbi:hypothetical protein AKL48_24610, partial [Salmonella enterica]|nr:hypothetical protein [Salmonella enterica]
ANTSVATISKNGFNFNVTGIAEGTTNVTVKYVDATNKLSFEKVIPVTVAKAAAFTGYAVEVDTNELDFYADTTPITTDKDEATVSVYEVDANGNKLKKLTADKTTLSFATGDTTSTNYVTISDATDVIASKAKAGAAEVVVKVGSLEVGKLTITVKDSTPAAASIKFTNTALTNLAVDAVIEDEVKALIKAYDQTGKEIDTDVDVTYTVTNATNGFVGEEIGKVGELIDPTKAATADIVVTSVKDGDKELLASPQVIKAVEKAAVTTLTVEEATTTLKSNHTIEGLTTIISLTDADGNAVNFKDVFSKFALTTGEDGPYDFAATEDDEFQYGPEEGYTLTKDVAQETVLDAEFVEGATGSYKVKSVVKKGDIVVATVTATIEVPAVPAP